MVEVLLGLQRREPCLQLELNKPTAFIQFVRHVLNKLGGFIQFVRQVLNRPTEFIQYFGSRSLELFNLFNWGLAT